MKLFISLISVITQINLCQSYDEINPLIIMTREEYIDLRNGKRIFKFLFFIYVCRLIYYIIAWKLKLFTNLHCTAPLLVFK